MSSPMVFASALATKRNLEQATQTLARNIRRQMNGRSIDALFVFFSPDFAKDAVILSKKLRQALHPTLLLGCMAEAVIGEYKEIEGKPAISVLAASLPGVTLTPIQLEAVHWQMLANGGTSVLRSILRLPETPQLMVALADPFSAPMEGFLSLCHDTYGEFPIVGGMASGSRQSKNNILLLNEQITFTGLVGIVLTGACEIDVIVSQGCRPIGPIFTATQTQRNLIFTLDEQPALAVLQSLFQEISYEDRHLIQTSGLYIGRAIQPEQEILGRGDFLIRGVAGFDPQTEAVAVGDYIMKGERLQFHVRDADTAIEDLEMMLLPQTLYDPPSGGLLFSCNGRGTRLYDHPHGDITPIQEALGNISMAGFFCAGELGPIGGRNFVHGHTASLVLFRPSS